MSDAKPGLTREERLALRLRENLRRRKTQARAMGASHDGTDTGEAESASSPETGLSNPAS